MRQLARSWNGNDPAPPEDRVLVARIADGHLDALGVLFDRHENAVRKYLQYLGIAPHDVDDLVQTIFLELAALAPKFDGRHNVRPWLLGISTIAARAHRRSLARLARNFAGSIFERLRAPPSTPQDAAERVQAKTAILRALDALPSKQREVFVLVEIEDAKGDEVARALGIPVGTVWTRLHHARKALRAALEDVR